MGEISCVEEGGVGVTRSHFAQPNACLRAAHPSRIPFASINGIERGITDADHPTGSDLLADVNPTFHWVQLAQRVPVRIAIDAASLPQTIEVRRRLKREHD